MLSVVKHLKNSRAAQILLCLEVFLILCIGKGASTEVRSPGYLKTPSYPSYYGSYQDLRWHITAPTGMVIELEQHRVGLYSSCSGSDYVKYIYDGKETKKCGEDFYFGPVVTKGNELTIILHSGSQNYNSYRYNSYGYRSYSSGNYGFNVLITFIFSQAFTAGSKVQTPDFPLTFSLAKHYHLKWTFTVPSGKDIYVQKHNITIGSNSTCNSALQYKYKGVYTSFCGEKTIGPYRFDTRQFTVELNNNNDNPIPISFSTYVWYCDDGRLTEAGLMQTPNYPLNYNTLFFRQWHFVVPEKMKIRIGRHSIQIQQSVNGVCFDFVKYAYDEEVKTFCGNDTVEEMLLGTRNLTVTFVSNEVNTFKGFSAPVSFEGSDTLTEQEGVISTANYPGNYPALTTFEWLIVAPPQYDILIKGHHLDLENSEDCSNDYVQYSHGRTVYKYCGNQTLQDHIFDINRLKMKFKSNGIHQRPGFSAQYKFVEAPCTATYTAPEGVFANVPSSSLSFEAESKWNNLKKRWCFRTAPGNRVRLQFSKHLQDEYDYCPREKILISKASQGRSQWKLHEFFTDSLPQNFSSNDNEVSITFLTHHLQDFQPFRVDWTFVRCSKLLTNTTGVISFPTEFQSTAGPSNCSWIIQGPQGSSIELTIESLSLHSENDSLKVYEGHEDWNNLQAVPLQDLQSLSHAFKVHSAGRSMTVYLSAENFTQTSRLNATYRIVPQSCGGEYTAGEGVIGVPADSWLVSEEVTCTWTIKVLEGYLPKLEFLSFNLSTSWKCEDAYVEIIDDDTGKILMKKQCGSKLLSSVTGTNRTVRVIFFRRSAESNFSLRFRSVYKYDIPVNKSGGMQQSSMYPEFYMFESLASWTLTAQKGSRISLFVIEVKLVKSKYCEKGSILIVRDGAYPFSNVLDKTVANGTLMTVSSGNKMLVELCGGVVKFAHVAIPDTGRCEVSLELEESSGSSSGMSSEENTYQIF